MIQQSDSLLSPLSSLLSPLSSLLSPPQSAAMWSRSSSRASGQLPAQHLPHSPHLHQEGHAHCRHHGSISQWQPQQTGSGSVRWEESLSSSWKFSEHLVQIAGCMGREGLVSHDSSPAVSPVQSDFIISILNLTTRTRSASWKQRENTQLRIFSTESC